MIFDQANPVEIAALITGLVATLFVIFFGIRTERVRANLPALEKLDNLIYKTVGGFRRSCILLVTGAVWANESWGRYWGWDAKETGALVAWLAYAGYLHTRIAHGWSGGGAPISRCSAFCSSSSLSWCEFPSARAPLLRCAGS